MTEKEKQLLLKDLCARLPYGVMCDFAYNPGNPQKLLYVTPYDKKEQVHLDAKEYKFGNGSYGPSDFDVEDARPYLRPMSSMTEEEDEEFKQVLEIELDYLASGEEGHTVKSAESSTFEIDFYNKHHFDHRGLIEKGLALEAPEEMYK